jgi:hypothetical protein
MYVAIWFVTTNVVSSVEAWSSNGMSSKPERTSGSTRLRLSLPQESLRILIGLNVQMSHPLKNDGAAIGLVEGTEIFVVYSLRGEALRLITARKATRDEREKYWNREI